MNHRQVLNGMQPRESRETWRNVMDWWEGPKEKEYVHVIHTDSSWLARFLRWMANWRRVP